MYILYNLHRSPAPAPRTGDRLTATVGRRWANLRSTLGHYGPSPADIGRRSANTVRGRRASTLRKNHFYNNRRATPYVLQDYNYNNQFPPARRRLHASRFTPNVNSKNSCFNSLIYFFLSFFVYTTRSSYLHVISSSPLAFTRKKLKSCLASTNTHRHELRGRGPGRPTRGRSPALTVDLSAFSSQRTRVGRRARAPERLGPLPRRPAPHQTTHLTELSYIF